jgi:putative FmdB family regulatory protein
MPLYEYECETCGKQEELLQKYDEPPPTCDACKHEMKKQISVTSFSLEGPGWAKDNYGLKE